MLLKWAVAAGTTLFSAAYIAAAAYASPATTTLWSTRGNLCLFCYTWHRAFLPPLDALVRRVHKATGADALLMLPLYLAFQLFLSQPFQPFSAIKDKARVYLPGSPKRAADGARGFTAADAAHPLPVFAAALLFALLAYLK